MTGDDFGRELQRLRDVQVAEAWEAAANAIEASDVVYAWEAVEVVRAAAPKPSGLVADASAGSASEREASNGASVAAVDGGKPLDAYPSDPTALPDALRGSQAVSTEEI